MITSRYRVCYGDTDQMGVVYYANYLRVFEFARAAYLREVGLPYSQVEAEGVHLPVAEAQVKYLQPARFDDLLEVDAALVKLGRASAEYRYRIRRDGAVLATGYTRHGCIDHSGKLVRLPESLRTLLQVDSEDVFA